jgi:hypothetical protein
MMRGLSIFLMFVVAVLGVAVMAAPKRMEDAVFGILVAVSVLAMFALVMSL